MSGPPPDPVERKRLRGNPGKRALPVPLAIVPQGASADVPPPHLEAAGVELWSTVVEFAAKWIAPSDRQVLTMLCESADERMDLIASIQDAGRVFYTDKGYAYANPAVGMLRSLEAQMTRWSSLLGLSPADRSRLGLAEVKAASKLEGIIASRTARGESA